MPCAGKQYHCAPLSSVGGLVLTSFLLSKVGARMSSKPFTDSRSREEARIANGKISGWLSGRVSAFHPVFFVRGQLAS